MPPIACTMVDQSLPAPCPLYISVQTLCVPDVRWTHVTLLSETSLRVKLLEVVESLEGSGNKIGALLKPHSNPSLSLDFFNYANQ